MSDKSLAGSEMANLEPGNDAPRKERHDFLIVLFRESRSGLIDFMFRQAAVLTLILGWLLSSHETHDFIQKHPSIQHIFIPALCLYFGLFIFWIWGFRQRSNTAYRHLLSLRYMPKEFYSPLRVTGLMAVCFSGAAFVICGILMTALLQIR